MISTCTTYNKAVSFVGTEKPTIRQYVPVAAAVAAVVAGAAVQQTWRRQVRVTSARPGEADADRTDREWEVLCKKTTDHNDYHGSET